VTLDELLTTDRATVDVDEAAAILGIGRTTAYEAHRSGNMPGALTLGRRRIVSVPALRRALGCDPSECDGPAGEAGPIAGLSWRDETGGEPPSAA
jgi:predicted DNA-binding transcriptional regulator AlpA